MIHIRVIGPSGTAPMMTHSHIAMDRPKIEPYELFYREHEHYFIVVKNTRTGCAVEFRTRVLTDRPYGVTNPHGFGTEEDRLAEIKYVGLGSVSRGMEQHRIPLEQVYQVMTERIHPLTLQSALDALGTDFLEWVHSLRNVNATAEIPNGV